MFQTGLEALIRSATRLRTLRILKLSRVREATIAEENFTFTNQWENIRRFMCHIVQLFAILSALRIA